MAGRYRRELIIRIWYQTSYVETGAAVTDLTRLRSTTDRYLGEAHRLRNTYRADVVILLAMLNDACGIAYF